MTYRDQVPRRLSRPVVKLFAFSKLISTTENDHVQHPVRAYTAQLSNDIRHRALVTSAAATGAFSLLGTQLAAAAEDSEIRPFKVNVPQANLDDLRRRVLATRWPAKETVADQSQGVRLAKLKELVNYWGTGYDWRKVEGQLNALPKFVTKIDGLDIQFIHVRSQHANALPLIITHGWPGSILELLKVIGPLTDPTAHGGRRTTHSISCCLRCRAMAFPIKPTETGWNADRIGLAWDV